MRDDFMNDIWQKASEAASYISERIAVKPNIAVILGSGLGELAYEVTERTEIPYSEIPHFPVSTVHHMPCAHAYKHCQH